jgi:hypothetical protein
MYARIGIGLAIVLVGWVVLTYVFEIDSPALSPVEEVVCTADVQLCEDGSYVSRVAPDCQFASCPGVKEIVSSRAVGIGTAWTEGGVSVTPTEILEDSRCPEDVVCVQAGTVRIKTTIMYDGETVSEELRLGETTAVGTYAVTLSGVLPPSFSTVFLQAEEYRFEFMVASTTGDGV